MADLYELIKNLVNEHAAQTGLPVVDGESIAQLAYDIAEDNKDYTENDLALISIICDGNMFRSGPVLVKVAKE